jgi:hypothetical protein
MSEESRKAGILRDSEITESIISAAIAVHRELGPDFSNPSTSRPLR